MSLSCYYGVLVLERNVELTSMPLLTKLPTGLHLYPDPLLG